MKIKQVIQIVSDHPGFIFVFVKMIGVHTHVKISKEKMLQVLTLLDNQGIVDLPNDNDAPELVGGVLFMG